MFSPWIGNTITRHKHLYGIAKGNYFYTCGFSPMVIFDNHMHLQERGDFINAIQGFMKYGGTHLNFCPYTRVGAIAKEKSYMGCYEEGLKLAEHAMQKTGVTIFVTCGPYPVDYLKLRDIMGRKDAVALMKKGMEEAQHLCMEKKAIAIGEIGRPHFKVDEEAWRDSNEILEYGMVLAREADVPVVIHMEGATPTNMKELVEMARKAGLPKEKVIKHYSPPLIRPEENHGIFPSVIASESNIRESLKKGLRFMLETDYLDDVRRPGAVLALHTIPKKLQKLLQQEEITDDEMIVINKENPETVYGIALD